MEWNVESREWNQSDRRISAWESISRNGGKVEKPEARSHDDDDRQPLSSSLPPTKTTATAMPILSFQLILVLLAQYANGFASNRRAYPPRPLSTTHAQIEPSNDGGAGSWRSKAQEFQNRPMELDGSETIPKRLNIAFVVSYLHSLCRH